MALEAAGCVCVCVCVCVYVHLQSKMTNMFFGLKNNGLAGRDTSNFSF